MNQLLRILQPVVDTIGMFTTNLADKTKQVFITINGTNYTLSPKLTELFRKGELQPDELGDFVVREVEGADGNTFLSLGLPGEDLQVKIEGWKGTAKSASKVITQEELRTLAVVTY